MSSDQEQRMFGVLRLTVALTQFATVSPQISTISA